MLKGPSESELHLPFHRLKTCGVYLCEYLWMKTLTYHELTAQIAKKAPPPPPLEDGIWELMS